MPDKASLVLAKALGDLPFPISKNAAIARVGDRVIPAETGDGVPLADLLRGVSAERFDDYLHASRLVDERWTRVARNLAAVEAAERLATARRRR